MRRFAASFCLTLTALAAACSGNGSVEADLAEAIGWLSRDGRTGPCQAVAIAPDHVLTAAHCVAERASWQPPGPGELQFVTAGRSLAVLEASLPRARSMAPSGAILDLQQDWAILRVATEGEPLATVLRVSGHEAAWLAFSFDEPVIKAGLVRANGGDEVRLAECTINALDGRQHLLTYRCGGGTGPGLSGSPLLVETDGGYQLIGVMSAKERLPSGDEVGVVVMPPVEAVEAVVRRD